MTFGFALLILMAMTVMAAELLIRSRFILSRPLRSLMRARVQARGLGLVEIGPLTREDVRNLTLLQRVKVLQPAPGLADWLSRMLEGRFEISVNRVSEHQIRIRGSRFRCLNPNVVNPLDFYEALLTVEDAHLASGFFVYQVNFKGVGRFAIMPVAISAGVVCLFVYQNAPLWVVVAVSLLLIAYGAAFVILRYAAQVVGTARFFDQLVLDYFSFERVGGQTR